MSRNPAPGAHQNHFNLIRMVAASLVLLSHSYALSTGDPMSEPLRAALGVTWGSIAVDVFFVTSGYLVTGSIVRRDSLRAFVFGRALRIYPGLVVALLLTTLVCSLWFTSLSFSSFWSQRQTWKYLVLNASLVLPWGLEYLLPETLRGVPTAKAAGGAVNGSLWTLPVELLMYALLAALFVLARAWRRAAQGTSGAVAIMPRTVVGMAVLALLADLTMKGLRTHHLELHMGAMFAAGAALWCMQIDFKGRGTAAWLVLAAIVAAALVDSGLFMVIYTLGLPFAILALAYSTNEALLRYNRLGDYSYGVYIYAFPIQQWCAATQPGISPWAMTGLAFPATLICAVLSWHLIEKRALTLKLTVPGR